MTATSVHTLHVPDEPTARAEAWLTAVLEGIPLADVLGGPDGITDWLWSRWRFLEQVGLDREGLGEIVLGYRRELWLWLAGERTWAQSCAGLIGRVNRRVSAATAGT
jgi:hypothetical protein